MRGPLITRDLRGGNDVFYQGNGRREPINVMSLECKAWRHQREEEAFRFRIRAPGEADLEGLLSGLLSASNLTDPVEVCLPVRSTFEDRNVTDMRDGGAGLIVLILAKLMAAEGDLDDLLCAGQ